MKYKVSIASVKNIISPITVYFGDTSKEFMSGKEMAEYEFDECCVIDKILLQNDRIAVHLKVNDRINDINWCGEEQVGFE